MFEIRPRAFRPSYCLVNCQVNGIRSDVAHKIISISILFDILNERVCIEYVKSID